MIRHLFYFLPFFELWLYTTLDKVLAVFFYKILFQTRCKIPPQLYSYFEMTIATVRPNTVTAIRSED